MKHFTRPVRFPIVILSTSVLGLFFFLGAGRSPADSSVFDWDIYSWPTGTLNQVYSGIGSPGTDFNDSFSGAIDRLELWHSPETNQIITGGLQPPENSLFIAAQFITNTETITLTVGLSIESANVSFLVMDVDSPNGGDGVDRVTVLGRNSQGQAVSPSLTATDPSCVDIVGSQAIGLCPVTNDTDNGNVMVEFPADIQTFIIVFGDAGVTGNFLGHGIALHDIHFDPVGPTPTPTLTGTATSTSIPPTETPTPTPPATSPPGTPPTPIPPSGFNLYLSLVMKFK